MQLPERDTGNVQELIQVEGGVSNQQNIGQQINFRNQAVELIM